MPAPLPALPDGVDPADLERIACDVARDAGRLVLEERPADLGFTAKSSRTDVVTEMDQRSQELLLDRLADLRPDDAVLGEEEGGRRGTSGVTWVVDPIDGTTNYLYGVPDYSVSVAAVVGDPSVPGEWRAVAAAVLNPPSGELFHAHRGGGARLSTPAGSRTLRANTTDDLGLSLVGTGFGYAADVRERQAGCSSSCCPGSATCAGTAARRSTSAPWRAVASTATTRPGSTPGTARPVSSWPRRPVRCSAGRSTTCPRATSPGPPRRGSPRRCPRWSGS